jgi:23S rRNA pseudouridine2605 synthase
VEEIRINKYISESGSCSRRAAEELIKLGRVKINGKVITELGTKVKNNDLVEVNEHDITNVQQKRYIILNKPIGYVTTSKEQFNRKSILDLVNIEERVYPVGRLDMYSEGLLILTNDGEITNAITHPSKHISKTYIATLNKEITKIDMLKLENGIDIGGYVTSKAFVKKLENNSIQITIFEGKNRQIRKMCECIGYKVIKLKRVSIGKLELGNLKSGEYKEITYEEIKKVFE